MHLTIAAHRQLQVARAAAKPNRLHELLGLDKALCCLPGHLAPIFEMQMWTSRFDKSMPQNSTDGAQARVKPNRHAAGKEMGEVA